MLGSMSEGGADTGVHGRLRTMLAAIAGIGLALLTFEAAFRLLLFGSIDLDPATHAPIATGRHRIGEGFGESHRDSRGIRRFTALHKPPPFLAPRAFFRSSQRDKDREALFRTAGICFVARRAS
jgi:hypothetical protein